MKFKNLFIYSIASLLLLGGCTGAEQQQVNPTSEDQSSSSSSSEVSDWDTTPISDDEKTAFVNYLMGIESVTLTTHSISDEAPRKIETRLPDDFNDLINWDDVESFSTFVNIINAETKIDREKLVLSSDWDYTQTIHMAEYREYLGNAYSGTVQEFINDFIEWYEFESTDDYRLVNTDLIINDSGTNEKRIEVINREIGQTYAYYSWINEEQEIQYSAGQYVGYNGWSLMDQWRDDRVLISYAVTDGTFNAERGEYSFTSEDDVTYRVRLKNNELHSYVIEDGFEPVEYFVTGVNDTSISDDVKRDPYCTGSHDKHLQPIKGTDNHIEVCSVCGAYFGEPAAHVHEEGYGFYCSLCDSVVGLEENFDFNMSFYSSSSSYTFRCYRSGSDNYCAGKDYRYNLFGTLGTVDGDRFKYATYNGKPNVVHEHINSTTTVNSITVTRITIIRYPVGTISGGLIDGKTLQEWCTAGKPMASGEISIMGSFYLLEPAS